MKNATTIIEKTTRTAAVYSYSVPVSIVDVAAIAAAAAAGKAINAANLMRSETYTLHFAAPVTRTEILKVMAKHLGQNAATATIGDITPTATIYEVPLAAYLDGAVSTRTVAADKLAEMADKLAQ